MAHITPATLRLDGRTCRPLVCLSAAIAPPNPSPDTARIGHPLQHPQHLAWRRLVLLVAAIAMMASMACVFSVERGIRYVDVTEEAGLIAFQRVRDSSSVDPIIVGQFGSVDGGLTWTLESNEPQTYGEFNLVVDTPRGGGTHSKVRTSFERVLGMSGSRSIPVPTYSSLETDGFNGRTRRSLIHRVYLHPSRFRSLTTLPPAMWSSRWDCRVSSSAHPMSSGNERRWAQTCPRTSPS